MAVGWPPAPGGRRSSRSGMRPPANWRATSPPPGHSRRRSARTAGGWSSTRPSGADFYHTGSWHPGPVVGGKWLTKSDVAFSHDGRLLAVDDGAPMLVDVATGRVLARLEAPDFQSINHFSFSPDDSKLAVATKQHTIYVWDLRAIRRRLAELGLDWDPRRCSTPPTRPAPSPRSRSPSASIAASSIPGWSQSAEKPEQIVARTTRAIEANPDDAEAHHQRGHALSPTEAVRRGHRRLHRRPEVQPGRRPPADLTGARGGRPGAARCGDRRRRGGSGSDRASPGRRSRTRPPRAWPASATTRPGPSRPAPPPTATRPAPSRWPGWRWS